MEEFRELLKKVGSGTHTSQSLSRSEAAMAMRKMLLAEATPAQIGAFFIAHRIRRPTGEELAGMLDAWQELGPQIPAIPGQPVRVLGIPYDARRRSDAHQVRRAFN
jgi:anthranilate phosphoribosyltransferase